ncbi:amidohydrolase family protein [Nocardia araoensis]|uniref:amidohydrolase family protein n=1 Tax=Nocardia araoensis TaxID=228600 RepID=UPI000303A23E|nr:amidohydrolase family protein [Nocardia araoensis]
MGALSRRRVLAGAAAAATTASCGLALSSADGPAEQDPGGRRIDIHHHFTPPQWLTWAEARGLVIAQALPWWTRWDLDAALSAMDSAGIETAVVTAATPVLFYANRAQHRESLTVAYQAMADLAAAYPGRFAFFAPLPLDDLDIAVWSAGYGRRAGAVGMNAMTHDTAGRYLGDPAFDALLTELDTSPTVINLHPADLPGTTPVTPAVPGVPGFLCDYPLATTRAAVTMTVHRTLDRFPNLSVILPHGGGFLPYIASRFGDAGSYLQPPVDPALVTDYLHRFYYDTAAPMSPASTPTLMATVDPAHILYGSDWPAAHTDLITTAASDLDTDPALTATHRHGINRRNALDLFPQLNH